MIIHSVASLNPTTGGVARTVSELADSLAAKGGPPVALLSQGLENEAAIPSREPSLERRIVRSKSRLSLALGLPLRNGLRSLIGERAPTLLHDNGIWLPSNHLVAQMARRYAIPLIIHPHGMLESWSLSFRPWKKKWAMKLYQRTDLETARLLVASTATEGESIRRLGLRQPLAIIPHGVTLEERAPPAWAEAAPSDKQYILFLSRIHPIKGLLNLISAWAALSPQGWELRLAGPDEGGHLEEVLRHAKRLNVGDSVRYLGPVGGERKSRLFREASLFVLPTYSENFGVVIAEALSYGVPVITTRGAPWADLQTYRCGWWIDIGVEPLKEAMHEALALDRAELQVMGARGAAYVRRFNWSKIAAQTLDIYRWVLGQGPRPASVIVD